MKIFMRYNVLLLLLVSLALGAEDAVTAVHGTIAKVDRAAKTVVVKTADGTEHTLHFVGKTTVRGADLTAEGAKESFHGLKEGAEVVAHYTKRGGKDTAVEFDKVGKDGLKGTEGTISVVDRTGKKIAVTTADGTKQTFKLSDHAVQDAGTDIGKGSEKGTKVIVYSSEDAGKKVAHFFEKI
jgi:hypothetical protein